MSAASRSPAHGKFSRNSISNIHSLTRSTKKASPPQASLMERMIQNFQDQEMGFYGPECSPPCPSSVRSAGATSIRSAYLGENSVSSSCPGSEQGGLDQSYQYDIVAFVREDPVASVVESDTNSRCSSATLNSQSRPSSSAQDLQPRASSSPVEEDIMLLDANAFRSQYGDGNAKPHPAEVFFSQLPM